MTPTKSIKLILALHIVSQFTSARTSMKAASNFLLTAILSALFIWQAWSTISKYQAARTTLEVSIIILDGYDRVSWFMLFLIFMCRLHSMMMVIFCSPLWLSVNSTCIQKEISWRRLRIYPWQQIENFSQKNLGQETCCLKAYITKLWMEHWRTLASLWQGSGKGHLAVSPFYILIARKVSNQVLYNRMIISKA